MGTTTGYLAIDGEHQLVLDWFASQKLRPVERAAEFGVTLHFESEGPLSFWPERIPTPTDASSHEKKRAMIAARQSERMPGVPLLDQENSPLVVLSNPHRRRGALWTAGEVTFTSTPLRTRFPELGKLHRSFVKWVRQFEKVYGPGAPESEFSYYLECNICSFDWEVFALPHAAAALRAGQYFVTASASDVQIDKLCQSLRLRGVECTVSDGQPN